MMEVQKVALQTITVSLYVYMDFIYIFGIYIYIWSLDIYKDLCAFVCLCLCLAMYVCGPTSKTLQRVFGSISVRV